MKRSEKFFLVASWFMVLEWVSNKCGASLSSTTISTAKSIDLSYQINHDPPSVVNAFSTQWATNLETNTDLETEKKELERKEDDSLISIDISNSWLQDWGVLQVIRRIISIDESANSKFTKTSNSRTTLESPINVNLIGRMNQISHHGMTDILSQLNQFYDFQQNMTKTSTSAPINAGNSTSLMDKPQLNIQVFDQTNITLNSSVISETPFNHTTDGGREPTSPNVYLKCIDFGLNHIGGSRSSPSFVQEDKKLCRELRHFLSSPVSCPHTLRLDQNCISIAICRAIGRGIIINYEASYNSTNAERPLRRLKKLSLSCNHDIGDAGCAAIAAALRLVNLKRHDMPNDDTSQFVLDSLDLSSCNIGDAGAEALALALESGPHCIDNLILSHNRITDAGALAIARALHSCRKNNISHNRTLVTTLDMSGNPGIGDKGASAIATCLSTKCLSVISLRSCSVQADGASAFSRAILSLAKGNLNGNTLEVQIDISGNAFGTHKSIKKISGTSASALSAKATKTSRKYIGIFGKRLSSGLKEVAGVDIASLLGRSTVESDDEMEEMMDEPSYGLENGRFEGDSDIDEEKLETEDQARHAASAGRCGARSFADPFLNATSQSEVLSSGKSDSLHCTIGMRKCLLDAGALDALAAAMVQGKEKFGISFSIDVSMNDHDLDHMSTRALMTGLENDSATNQRLSEMAQRYQKAVEALQRAQVRAAEAAAAMSQRSKAEAAFGSAWDAGVEMDRENYDIDDVHYEQSDLGDYDQGLEYDDLDYDEYL